MLQRPLRRAVAAKLDLGIDDDAVVASDARIDRGGPLAERERTAEVVSGQGERAEAAGGREIPWVEAQGLIEDALGLRIEGRVARFPHLLEVGEPKLGVGVGIRRRLAHLGL